MAADESAVKSCSKHYACVACLHPNESLYKQYSSAKNIKLTSCPSCGRDVDPYIERELLLVVMDMMLLRISAYRHFFFNMDLDIGVDSESSSTGTKTCFTGVIVCLALRTFLKHQALAKWETDPHSMDVKCYIDYNGDDSSVHCNNFGAVLKLVLISAVELLLLFVGTFASTFNAVRKVSKDQSKMIWRQIYLAITAPELFHIFTFLVLIFLEDSDSSTVCVLGATFVFCFHYLALHCCMERILREGVGRDGFDSRWGKIQIVLPGWPFLVGFAMEIFLPYFLFRDHTFYVQQEGPIVQVFKRLSRYS
uniref:Protein ARV n=1 Tax=Chaetoceros debilis TaxID=122233 RepID=A0A7S3QJN8_9STRA|mmetsp:Transcript_3795/g.5676  ORF Transcript_3795/g.5676 Transcript_3795/m.5676 type:complete len:308 (+) Transcript_3795:64-987(+)